jgi:hypothetical protein
VIPSLVFKFRILATPIVVNPDMTNDIIKVACVRSVDKEELETCSNTSLTFDFRKCHHLSLLLFKLFTYVKIDQINL